jgi:Phosphoribosylformylglycinamidine (FGAM) synthase, synthetase domain
MEVFQMPFQKYADHSKMSADINLRDIYNAEPGMNPLEIWWNEAQDRYVLSVHPDDLEVFDQVCKRERCPYAVVGEVATHGNLRVRDEFYDNYPIDMPMDVLFGKPPKTKLEITSEQKSIINDGLKGIDIEEAALKILRFPTVADKTFLIHIGDHNSWWFGLTRSVCWSMASSCDRCCAYIARSLWCTR